jgi:hypothetical protein
MCKHDQMQGHTLYLYSKNTLGLQYPVQVQSTRWTITEHGSQSSHNIGSIAAHHCTAYNYINVPVCSSEWLSFTLAQFVMPSSDPLHTVKTELSSWTYTYCIWHLDRDSSVGIATRYGLDGPGIKSRWGRDFPHLSRSAVGPTQPPIQWVPGLS